jgi:hypothetical protein
VAAPRAAAIKRAAPARSQRAAAARKEPALAGIKAGGDWEEF